jgi:hypothetical protein
LGPEMRITAMAARPGAVERAKIVALSAAGGFTWNSELEDWTSVF